MENEEAMTWADLKDFVMDLPEDLMHTPVRWWGDARGGTVKVAYLIDDIHVLSDDAFVPLSTIEGEPEEFYEVVLPKGTPVLQVDM